MTTGCPLRTETFGEDELVRDAMLCGRVTLLQPRTGYRAGIDPVFLAASVAAKPGQSILELGCGGGPALCCLGVRVPGVELAAIELQSGYAHLARKNLALNGLEGEILEGDLSKPPPELKARSFDHVMANPPYFEKYRRTEAEAADREIALAGETLLSAWVRTAAKRLKPRGYATFIQRSERLPELMAAMSAHLGAIELLPLAPRHGRGPRLILVRGRKGGRAAFRFHPPLVIHQDVVHADRRSGYSEAAAAIIQEGAALQFPA